MEKSYVIATEEEGIRLSVPIHSENNAQLMYNTLYHLKRDRSASYVIVDEEEYFIDNLVILDENGDKVEPVLDKELFGTEEDREKEKQRVLDKLQSMAEDTGDTEHFNRSAVENAMPCYVVEYGVYDGDYSNKSMDAVWDEDKANDMINALRYGMNPDAILVTDDGTIECDRTRILKVEYENGMCVNETEIGYEDDPEWADRSDEEFTLTEEDLAPLNDKDCMTL